MREIEFKLILENLDIWKRIWKRMNKQKKEIRLEGT